MAAFFKKYPHLFPLLMCIIGVSIRLIFVWGNTIAYMFDHARDSIEIMAFLRTGKPLLIGPRSSIDGLFFGPAWYYLTAPFYWLSNGHPLAPVGALLILFCIKIFLVNKHFGKWPVIMTTFTPGWWWIATSAWNPFPLAMLSLLLLIILKKTQEAQLITMKQAAAIGFIIGLGFHFSTAYAMFYPLIIWVCLWRQKVKWNFKHFSIFTLFFWIPWLPQLAFDFRHEFIQTKAVIAYIFGPILIDFSVVRTIQTIGTISSSLFWANLPGVSVIDQSIQVKMGVTAAVFLFFLFVRQLFKQNLAKKNMLFESWMFILVPFLGYTLLHFSSWYVVGMYPAGALIIAYYFSSFNIKWQKAMVAMYMIAAMISVFDFFIYDRAKFLTGHNFLPIKMDTMAKVRELAGNEPFSSYQFVPEVYDFTYQYLYFWQAQHGWKLPVEFSYQPNVVPYYSQKEVIMSTFVTQQEPAGTKPKLLFFIVEKPEYQQVLDEWWTRQLPHTVIKEVKMSDELTIYEALPKN